MFSNSLGHLLKVDGKTEALLCVDTLLPLGTGGPLKPQSRCCMRTLYLPTKHGVAYAPIVVHSNYARFLQEGEGILVPCCIHDSINIVYQLAIHKLYTAC